MFLINTHFVSLKNGASADLLDGESIIVHKVEGEGRERERERG